MPESNRDHPFKGWIARWALDIHARVMRDELVSETEFDVLAHAMGHRLLPPEKVAEYLEHSTSKPIGQLITEAIERHHHQN